MDDQDENFLQYFTVKLMQRCNKNKLLDGWMWTVDAIAIADHSVHDQSLHIVCHGMTLRRKC